MARKASTSERARRTIALLGHLKPDTRIPLEDLARLVGTSASDLAQDLTALSMCGVWPYDPYALFPVVIEGSDVVVFGDMPALRGPVRLSASEASALATALQAVGFDAADPLTSRLLAAASAGFDAASVENSLRSMIATHDRGVYETLAKAVEDHVVVAIEHMRPGGEESTTREIEPVALFTERSAWYVTAWCRLSGSWRTFRVDRIRSSVATNERFAARARSSDASGAFTAEGLPLARLRFSPGVPFIPREWPGGRVVEQETDGSLIAEVPYAGTPWIARRILARVGVVEAVGPPEVRTAVRDLAERTARELG